MATSENLNQTTTTQEQPKRYIYTEKGASKAPSHHAKAGDPYNRPVSKSILRQYLKAGFIEEAK